jgi:hypothetical protein
MLEDLLVTSRGHGGITNGGSGANGTQSHE